MLSYKPITGIQEVEISIINRQNVHKKKANKNDLYRAKMCRSKQGFLVTGLLSLFKIKPKERTRSRETPVPQSIPSAGGACNLP